MIGCILPMVAQLKTVLATRFFMIYTITESLIIATAQALILEHLAVILAHIIAAQLKTAQQKAVGLLGNKMQSGVTENCTAGL